MKPISNIIAKLGIAIKETAHLWWVILLKPLPIGLIFLYLVGRTLISLFAGGVILTAIRSTVLGLLFNGLAIFVIEALHYFQNGSMQEVSLQSTHWEKKNPLVLGSVLLLYVFWFLYIVDDFQRQGKAPGYPILQWLPGYDGYYYGLQNLTEWLNLQFGFWSARMWGGVIQTALIGFLIPVILLWLFGFRWKDLGLNFRKMLPAMPFIILLGIWAIANGVNSSRLSFLVYGLINPAFREEFFDRSIVQRSLSSYLSPAGGWLAASVLFALIHIPAYTFDYHAGMGWAVTAVNLFDLTLAGLFYGTIFRRTGSVFAGAMVHLLQNSI